MSFREEHEQYDHENELDLEADYHNNDFKNEYSTFIEELEETTEKLMNEVFNSEYTPEVDDQSEDDEKDKQHTKSNKKNSLTAYGTTKKKSINNYNFDLASRNFMVAKQQNPHEQSESFKNFMKRSNKWCERREANINRELCKKVKIESKELTFKPKIERGSIEKLEPIYERAHDLHFSKEKKRAYKKIEQKKKEDEEISVLSFHPEINSKTKTRTLEEYLKDKSLWEKKKVESREFRKLQQDANKLSECSFAPTLIAKPIESSSNRLKPGEKVEERLLRSLEKVFTEI